MLCFIQLPPFSPQKGQEPFVVNFEMTRLNVHVAIDRFQQLLIIKWWGKPPLYLCHIELRRDVWP